MYGSKDLVNQVATCDVKFINQTLSILFTDEELAASYYIESTESKSTKLPLDLEKIQLLKGYLILLICHFND